MDKSQGKPLSTVLAGLLLAFGMTLSACHTIEGAGRDIEAAGEGTQELSRETREELR